MASAPFQVTLGMTADLIPTASELARAGSDLASIQNALEPRYGTVQEGFASMGGILALGGAWSLEPFAESAVVGSLHNPVVPELSTVFVAEGGLRLSGRFYPLPDWILEPGLAAALGTARSLQAVGTDFIDHVPILSGGTRVLAPSLKVARDFRLGHDWTIASSALARYSLWGASVPGFASAWRWNVAIDAARPVAPRTSLALEARLGPQPLPVAVLPLAWDAMHPSLNSARLGAYVGAGAKVEYAWASPGTGLLARAGLYGGYVGGEIRASWKRFSLDASTWGLEEAAAFQGLEGRIYSLTADFRL